jgi:Transcription mediator complex subunit Med12
MTWGIWHRQGLAGTVPLPVLARGVPNTLFRNNLFEELVARRVPLSRAAWLIRVVYINLFRCVASSLSLRASYV